MRECGERTKIGRPHDQFGEHHEDEAQQRSQLIANHAYRVTVDLTGRGLDDEPLADPAATFISTSTVQFASEAGHSWLDLIADEVIDAWLDGVQLPRTPTMASGSPSIWPAASIS